ncbi:hypothetical protein DOY81_002616 [Sarcophaga bullata]|nr:hypothetical protein DOY81_002616 [Sarcophaga bullata]
MYRNCTNNCCCYDPCYCCYCNYCCCNPAINACDCRYFVCKDYAGNTKCCTFRRLCDMPSKKKSSFDTLEKPKKKKKMECTCNETHTAICKRIREIDKRMGKCKCMASDDNPCSSIAPPVNDCKRNVDKREVYLLPYYGVPIKKNKKYILECTSFESTDASCCETPDNSNNNQNEWCPRLPPECDTNESMDTACRPRTDFSKPQTGKLNFVGRCTSFESLASLQPTKRNSCHFCCSRKANNNKSRRHGSAPMGKSWSQLDVIDEEDIEDLPQPTSKRKVKDFICKTQGNSSKLQPPRKYDANANANAIANASANRNARGSGRRSSSGTGQAYGIASCCATANANANANIKGNGKCNDTGYVCCCAPVSTKDYCNDAESKMQKSLEDSCADFLNIVTDNILETVQTSVSVTLKDYCTKTTEKIDQAFEKLEQNDVAMRCLCGRLMEKLTEQNERDYEKILCLLEQLKESQQSKQNSAEKIYVQSRASQYEVTDDCGYCMQPTAPCGLEQPEQPYYAPQTCYVRESVPAQTTDPESCFSACCAQQSETPPQSSPEIARPSMNCCGQNENLEIGNEQNGNGKNGNGKKGNGKNGKGKNGNEQKGNGKNGNAQEEIVVNEILPNENENQELVNKVIIPPCRCCHKCTCTPKPAYTGPPRPNICLETDEKKKSNGRECGGCSDQYDEEGEESLSPSGYHFVSDKCKSKANVLENKTSSLNDGTKSGIRTCNSNSAARSESTSGMFTTFSMKPTQKTVFQSANNNSVADIPATSSKDKNSPELDLYGNYDTSGYATEPEDNNDAIDATSARNTPTNKSQFLPVTLQYIRNETAPKTATTNRTTTTKKHSKKRVTSTSKSPSSRLSRL